MIRNIVLLVVLFGCTISAPLNKDEAAVDKVFELFHPKFLEFYKLLTPEDKITFLEVESEYVIGEDPTEYLAVIKAASPSLHAKYENTLTFINGLFSKLPEKAKEFAQYAIRSGKDPKKVDLTGKEQVKVYHDLFNKYDALSKEDKTELNKTFALFEFLYGEKSVIREAYGKV